MTGVTSDSVGLSWTVPQGQFDSFMVQYKDRDGQPQVVPVDGSLREVSVVGLDPDRRYKLLLYGLHNSKRVGPLSAIAVTGKCVVARTPVPLFLLALLVSLSHKISEISVSLRLGKECLCF